jgi:hypothetical protein
VDPALAKNYREILNGPDSAAVLRMRADRVIARAVLSPSAALADNMEQLLHWYKLGSENSEERIQRRSFAWVVAIAKTVSPEILDKVLSDEMPLLNLDESLYYHGYAVSDPKSIVRHFSAAALRLAFAVCKSFWSMPDELWERAKRIFTIESIKTLAVIGALWVGATVLAATTGVGVPIAAFVNFALSAYGMWSLWGELQNIGADLKAFWSLGMDARSDADLEQAGQAFGRALAGGLITALEVYLYSRAFRAAEGIIARRLPTPARLKAEYERAVKEREGRKSKAERLLDEVASGARGAGMRELANRPDEVVTGALIAVTVVGGVALTAWALSAKGEP